MVSVAMGLIGCFSIPCLPLAIQLGVEVSFPAPEDVSTGALLTLGNLAGTGWLSLLSKMRQHQPEDCLGYHCWVPWLYTCMQLCLVITVFIVRPPLLRTAYERQMTAKTDASVNNDGMGMGTASPRFIQQSLQKLAEQSDPERVKNQSWGKKFAQTQIYEPRLSTYQT